MQQFPQVAIARHLLQTLKAYAVELGLTPAARTRIEADPLQEIDDEERALREILGE